MPLTTLRSSRLQPAALALAGLICAAVIGADRPAAPPPAKPVAATPSTPSPDSGESQMDMLIAQALDQTTQIEFKEVPIREAVRQLSEKTGIPIEVEVNTVRFLPYGSDTRVTAAVRGQPLKDVLTAIVRPIGLVHAVEKGKVIVRPSKPLQRLAKRASWEDLTLLESLQSQPWSSELFDRLKIQFQDAPADDLQANRQQLRKLADSIGAGSAAEVLDLATDRFGWTWYPENNHVVVISKPKQIERQIERRVSLRYQESNLKDVLIDLAHQADTVLKLDPGVLAAIPGGMADRYSLSVDNATVRQALEIIAGQTGLGYVIDPDGIRITANVLGAPSSTSQSAATADETALRTVERLRSNSFVGTITIRGNDGTEYSFFVRENDLPADVNELRKQRIKEAGERLREALAPATRPN
jgi:type II secretory pathway component GspD/PulD (secretin)